VAKTGQAKSIGDQLRAAVSTIVKAMVLEIDSELRKSPEDGGTPVDTGFARASWVPSIIAPATGTSEGDHEAGVAALVSYKLEDGPAYETNNAAYIQRLNAGSSKQAPALFIEAAVDRALAAMQARYGSRAISLDQFRNEVGGAGAANVASAYNPLGGD